MDDSGIFDDAKEVGLAAVRRFIEGVKKLRLSELLRRGEFKATGRALSRRGNPPWSGASPQAGGSDHYGDHASLVGLAGE